MMLMPTRWSSLSAFSESSIFKARSNATPPPGTMPSSTALRCVQCVGMLGIRGDEIVHAFLDMMYAGAPHTVIIRAMHIHPTVAEYMPTAAQ